MSLKLLLIGRRDPLPWFQNLTNALASLGEYDVLTLDEALLRLVETHYDLVILDAARVEKVLEAVAKIRALQKGIRFLVIATTLTWRPVREAIQAGVMDYISKSMSEQEYLAILRGCLEKTPLL